MRLSSLRADLRYAARTLVKSPGFSLATILVLALGIGANTAIFSVVNAVLLRPLAFADPARLVRVWHVPPPKAFPGQKTFTVSPANYLDWQREARSFESMAIYGYRNLNLTGGREAEFVAAAGVSRDFFSLLGRQPELGRTFTPQENATGAGRVVILSHALWTKRFGADPGIVGRDVRINDESCRVVGVMRPDFRFPDWAKMWVPLAWDAKEQAVRNNHNYLVLARLRPGAKIEEARSEMRTISARLERAYPEDDQGWGAAVLPLQDDLVDDVRPLLWVLLGAVGCVLLIACGNVANLMLSKTLSRRKEIAVRTALGANRVRLFQQLLCESLLLSLTGGAIGLVLSGFGVDRIVAFLAGQLPGFADVSVDARVLAFALVLSVATGVLAGVVPAWRQTRADVVETLKQGLGRGGADAGDHSTRGFLVVAEVALSLVLLVGAGLLLKSLWFLSRVDPGFDSRNVVTLTTFLGRPGYKDPQRQRAYATEALGRLRAIPGVDAAGAVNDLPLTGGGNWPIAIAGQPTVPVAQQPAVSGSIVAGDYFRSLRIPLRRGRLLTPADDSRAPSVVLVSESMARRFWPGQDAIGKRLSCVFVPGKDLQIVGIVGDVKQSGLDRREGVSQMYLPFEQLPEPALQFTVRAIRSSAGISRAAEAALRAVDPDQPLVEVKTMDAVFADSLARQRFTVALLTAFAVLALALATIGVYSVLAYAVRRRGREIGVRMALGAQTRDVLRLIVLQGMRPTLLGMAIGLVAALVLRRVLTSLLYGVGASDPATLAAVGLLLAAVSLAACLVPAYRAARIDPMEALRNE